jgi:hypothetical protein
MQVDSARKFYFSVSLNNSYVHIHSTGTILSLTAVCEKFSVTAIMTKESAQNGELHSPHVRSTSIPYTFMRRDT